MMKKFLCTTMVLGALAAFAIPASADMIVDRVLLEPHEGGPKVRVMLKGSDGFSREQTGPQEDRVYTTLYVRADENSDWHIVEKFEDTTQTPHGPTISHDVLTSSYRALQDVDGKRWQAKVVVENPGQPANQKILWPTFDAAGR